MSEKLKNKTSFLLFIFPFLFLTVSAYAAEEVSVTDEIIPTGHFQFSFSSSMRSTQGSFDPYGTYQPLPDGSKSYNLSNRLGLNYRFSKQWEMSGAFSVREGSSQLPTGSTTSSSAGSPTMDVRYHIVNNWAHPIIHVGFGPSLQFSDRHQYGNPGASLPDDFGDGSVAGASARVGIGGAHSFKKFRIASDVTAIIPFASSRVPGDAPAGSPAVSIRQGNRIQTSEGVGYSLSKIFAINAGLKQMWATDSTADGADVADTASRMFTSNVGVSYNSSASFRWTLGYETQYPFYAYLANQSYSPAVSLGMMYDGL